MVQNMSKVLSCQFSSLLPFSSLNLMTGSRQSVRPSARLETGMLDRGTRQNLAPQAGPRVAGRGARKAARHLSPKGAGH